MVQFLVVEDDDDIRAIIINAIESSGYDKVLEAENGEEGLKLFEEHSPNFVITDIVMPRLDGIGLIKQVRALNEKVPIIVISAFPEKGNDALALGADVFIDMPFRHNDLVEKIQNLVKEVG